MTRPTSRTSPTSPTPATAPTPPTAPTAPAPATEPTSPTEPTPATAPTSATAPTPATTPTPATSPTAPTEPTSPTSPTPPGTPPTPADVPTLVPAAADSPPGPDPRTPPPAPPTLVAWSTRTGTPGEFFEGVVARITEWEPALHAFTHLDLERAASDVAAADARWAAGIPLSPIDGMPIAVKEIIDSAQFATELGSPLFAGRHPDADAEIVARLRTAGAVVIGMTTSTPFACGTTTLTANPHALAHTPGGSSAGSGAAVGAGLVPVALATQTGASTIRPASYCGAFGYKPTHRRLPMTGIHPVAPSLDDVGLIAASLADLTLTLAALDLAATPHDADPTALTPQRSAAEENSEPDAAELHLATQPPNHTTASAPLRLGLVRLDSGDEPTSATWAAFDDFLTRLTRSFDAGGGAEPIVRGVVIASPETAPALAAFDEEVRGSTELVFDLFAAEAAPILAPYVERDDPEPDPRIRDLVSRGRQQHPKHLAGVHALKARLRHRLDALATDFDALITLSTANPAPLGHATTGSRTLPATWSFLGAPALSLPLLEVDGLPLGVQLLGFPGRDDHLIDTAGTLLALSLDR